VELIKVTGLKQDIDEKQNNEMKTNAEDRNITKFFTES
jgi:hypothetical protein